MCRFRSQKTLLKPPTNGVLYHKRKSSRSVKRGKSRTQDWHVRTSDGCHWDRFPSDRKSRWKLPLYFASLHQPLACGEACPTLSNFRLSETNPFCHWCTSSTSALSKSWIRIWTEHFVPSFVTYTILLSAGETGFALAEACEIVTLCSSGAELGFLLLAWKHLVILVSERRLSVWHRLLSGRSCG